jgi:hypothetical protein
MSKVDRELAKIETRTAEVEPAADQAAPKSKLRAAVKRVARDMLVRRTSSKQ